MRTTGTDGLAAVSQAPHVAPDHFCIAEAGPAVTDGFLLELLHGASTRRNEQGLASHTVVEGDLLPFLQFFQEFGHFLKIALAFGVVTVVATDSIRHFPIATPSQEFHHRLRAGAICLGTHGFIFTDQRVGRFAETSSSRGKYSV